MAVFCLAGLYVFYGKEDGVDGESADGFACEEVGSAVFVDHLPESCDGLHQSFFACFVIDVLDAWVLISVYFLEDESCFFECCFFACEGGGVIAIDTADDFFDVIGSRFIVEDEGVFAVVVSVDAFGVMMIDDVYVWHGEELCDFGYMGEVALCGKIFWADDEGLLAVACFCDDDLEELASSGFKSDGFVVLFFGAVEE